MEQCTIGFVGFGNLARRLYSGFGPIFKQNNTTILYTKPSELTDGPSELEFVNLNLNFS